MKNEVILYKRNKSFIRFFTFLMAVICVFTTVIMVIDSIHNNQKIEIELFTFPIIPIVVAIYTNLFTGYTKEILISYSDKGFNAKDNGFIEWCELKSWNIKKKSVLRFKVNESDDYVYIYTLTLNLRDGRKIIFPDDEVNDINKFIKFLHKNFKNKRKGNFKLW